MRRFELTDGTSNKFWEVDVEGNTLTTHWGRIGTAGQMKTKSFATSDKAKSEHDALVKEKLGKGYSEVAGAATLPATKAPTPPAPTAAAPPTAPAPSPPAPKMMAPSTPRVTASSTAPAVPPTTIPAKDEAPKVHWTDALRRRCYPRRGTGIKSPRLDARAALANVHKHYESIAAIWAKSPSLDEAGIGPLLKAACERLASNADQPATPEIEGAAAIVLQHRAHWQHEVPFNALVEWWVATAGAQFAIKALLASLDLGLGNHYGTQATLVGAQTNVNHATRFGQGQLAGWSWLRGYLAAVDEATWKTARDEAARLRDGATPDRRLAIDFLFPDVHEWAESDARDALASGSVTRGTGALLTCIRDAELLCQLVTGRQTYTIVPSSSGWQPEVLEVAVSMIDGAGPPAARAVAALLDGAGSAEWKRDCAEALSIIDSDEAIGLLAARLDTKEVLASASEALPRSPRRALPALAAQVGRGRSGQVAESLLAMIVKQHPRLTDELLPSLSDGARRVVETIRARTAIPKNEAGPSELPTLLVSPPWLDKKKRSDTKPLALDLLHLPDELAWRPEQKEAWVQASAAAAGWMGQHLGKMTESEQQNEVLGRLGLGAIPRDPKTPPDKLRELIAATAVGRFLSGSLLMYLPPHLALAIWEAIPAQSWSYSYDRLEGFLLRYELAALPGLQRFVESAPTQTIELCIPFRSLKLAPLMAHAFANLKKARAVAQRWLLMHDEYAAVGLIPQAVGSASKARDGAGTALRFLAASGRTDVVMRAAARYGSEAESAVRAVLEFDAIDLYPSRLPKMPGFVQAGTLSRPLLKGRAAGLPIPAVENFLTMLAFSRLEEPYAGIARVKEACDLESLAAFAWDLFSAWLMAAAPSKEAWAFHALGHLGDDACARKLAVLVREWPGEAAHARAVTGLDVLAAIGTDVALMHLNGIAQKVKFKGLQEKAREKIAAVAEARGFTTDELADRLVPDLGLDERGSLTLDFGPRTFMVGFDEHLRPFVRDQAGKQLPDLPKPGKNDDAEKAQAAQAVWKTLKKDVKTLAGQQILRLELGMCARRRWTTEVFRMFLVEHPLLQHLVRRVLWAVFDESGALKATFRVCEDGSYADANDDQFVLADGSTIGVAHSLDLTEAVAARWGQVFGDYEILQPFKQLGREAHAIAPAEKESKKLERFVGVKVPTGKVLGLEARGWRRGAAQDGGGIWWFEKALPNGFDAQLTLEPGIIVGMVNENPEQKLGEVTIVRSGSWNSSGEMAFGQLDTIVFSELVRDIEALRS